ncbi:hypothetical protein [Vagococcus hydrophili]|uniref:Uncharacterized protein n=1 Tax=Vagococcus hydrophili TaxID=2714947 RepID=A0A6G8AWY7_9ENTE|nr:hypothetical protein [Vagococcus hydrophili]QIL49611.1 hypothetical protein G7082_14435 [Vagococcus hydrophili]
MDKKNKKAEIPQVSEEYGLVDFRPLTMKERSEIYSKLTKVQRALIDEHRKYLIRSEFIKDSYLSASDWEFVDLRIDERYPETHQKEKQLYCQCGRRLKYQYIVKSKETGKKMGLGIQHFKDHLNIPQQVAKEIVDRLSNVDFGLDELLWLKRKGIEFPRELWENYALYLYKNQQVKQPFAINYSLAQRIGAFKEADMPIYFSDYQLLIKEIKELQKASIEMPQETINESNLKEFKRNLLSNIQQKSLFDRVSIWSLQIQKQMASGVSEPKLPTTYFEELYEILSQSGKDREKKLLAFGNRGMGKWIQKEVYLHLLKTVEEYGLSESFLNGIHPFMREGLSDYIVEDQKDIELKQDLEEITEILAKYDVAEREKLLELLIKNKID